MISVLQLLEELNALDIRLTVDGENLHLDAPDNNLTRSRLPEIRRQKSAIIKALRRVRNHNEPHAGPDRLEQKNTPSSDAEPEDLIRWFLDEGQHLFPDRPCTIGRVPVRDPQRFKGNLLQEISLWPEAPRARSGDLENDLLWLRNNLPISTAKAGKETNENQN